jgi:hypothetical protein
MKQFSLYNRCSMQQIITTEQSRTKLEMQFSLHKTSKPAATVRSDVQWACCNNICSRWIAAVLYLWVVGEIVLEDVLHVFRESSVSESDIRKLDMHGGRFLQIRDNPVVQSVVIPQNLRSSS